MPPKVKISREHIVNTALQMVREQGIESLNARSLAEKIGCSIHPIFRAFDTMEMLKEEVVRQAEIFCSVEMMKVIDGKKDNFRSAGLQYIRFAKEEKNLFRLLFMSNGFNKKSMTEIVDSDKTDEDLIRKISQATDLSLKNAKELFIGIWLTTHGIATLFATNDCFYNDKEVERILGNTYDGLVLKLKEEENGNKGTD